MFPVEPTELGQWTRDFLVMYRMTWIRTNKSRKLESCGSEISILNLQMPKSFLLVQARVDFLQIRLFCSVLLALSVLVQYTN